MSGLPIIPLSNVPQPFRQLAHFVKIANEYASRDPVIYYWCLFKAVDDAMKIDSSSPEAKQFLLLLVDILEQVKKAHKENDAIMQNVVAQSHIEDQAQRLFQYAESQDASMQFNQKMMKAFYTCGYLFDVLTMFGSLDENIQSARKYSKWRATYIFGCLKRGEQPIPGNQTAEKSNQNGNLGDIASDINDELSAELQALNASINGPPPAKPNQTEFGGGVPHQSYPPYQPPTSMYPGGGYPGGIGTYPSIDGGGAHSQQHYPSPPAGPQSHFHLPAGHHPFSGGHPAPPAAPKPGLQFSPQSSNNQPGPPKARGATMSPPPSAGQAGAARKSSQQAPNLKLEDYLEAKKYTKFAASALDYEDPKTAVDYLQKAIAVLQKHPPV